MRYYAYYDNGGFVHGMTTDVTTVPEGLSYLDIGVEPKNTADMFFSAGQLQQIPPRPDGCDEFNYTSGEWVGQTVQKSQGDRWAYVKAARQAALTAPLTTPYGTFDATPDAQKSITDAVLMLQTLASLGTPTDIDFTLADNSTVTLTTAQMVQVGILLGQRTQALYATSRAKRAEIDAATTKEQVEAITW